MRFMESFPNFLQFRDFSGKPSRSLIWEIRSQAARIFSWVGSWTIYFGIFAWVSPTGGQNCIDDPTVGTVRRQGLRSQTVSKQLFGDKTDNFGTCCVVWPHYFDFIHRRYKGIQVLQQGTDYPLRFDPFGGKFFYSNAVIGARSQ